MNRPAPGLVAAWIKLAITVAGITACLLGKWGLAGAVAVYLLGLIASGVDGGLDA